MTKHNVSIEPSVLAGLLSNPAGLGELVQGVLNEILQAQMSQHLNAIRALRRTHRFSQRQSDTQATHAYRYADTASTANTRRQFLYGHLQALPAQ